MNVCTENEGPNFSTSNVIRHGSRIWSSGGPASDAKSCWYSEAESHEWSKLSATRVQDLLKGLEAFGFLMRKYAFSYILETLFLSFLRSISSISTPKASLLYYLRNDVLCEARLKNSKILTKLCAEWSEAQNGKIMFNFGASKTWVKWGRVPNSQPLRSNSGYTHIDIPTLQKLLPDWKKAHWM